MLAQTAIDALIEMLHDVREKQSTFWESLSEDELAEVGKVDDWAPKDIMAHISVWNDRLAVQLEAAARNETPVSSGDFEHANREIFKANKDKSWDELTAYEVQTFARLEAAITALPADAIMDSTRFDWTEGRPLFWRICFSPIYHGMAHIADLMIKRGSRTEAFEAHEWVAEKFGGLSDSDDWQGTTLYNLACIYALHGEPARAIELLGKALVLNPGLIDWSKEDSDLDALRQDPAFLALYQA
jgi:tetratricopeptide (TPR) repeat protein